MMLHSAFSSDLAVEGIPVLPAIGLTAAAFAYARGIQPTRDRTRPMAFVAGWITLAIALASPLHEAGERLLSMHMIQHVLVMAVAAPLLVWSTPVGALLRGLPVLMRRPAVTLVRTVAPARRSLSTIPTACAVQLLALWVWHAPALYQASVRYGWVHALQHSTLLITALLFWASIPMHERAAKHAADARPLAAIASLFITVLLTGVLSALFTFARLPWYSVYVTHGTAAAVADQQLAGVIMWVPGAFPYVGVALMFVWRILHRREWHAPLIVNRPLSSRHVTLFALATTASLAMIVSACNRPGYSEGSAIAHGDAHRGQHLMKSYGCVACHMVPGVPGGRARVGPDLAGLKERNFIAGVMPNSPENLQKWIQDPKVVDKLTAMPNVGVTEKDAQDIAAYLYSIR